MYSSPQTQSGGTALRTYPKYPSYPAEIFHRWEMVQMLALIGSDHTTAGLTFRGQRGGRAGIGLDG